MIDILGSLLFEVLLWPAEWLTEKLWEGHRTEPTGRRILSALWRGTLTVIIFISWIAVLIGIPVAIIVLTMSP